MSARAAVGAVVTAVTLALASTSGSASCLDFLAAPRYASGDNPTALATSDFNADGRADLASANLDGSDVSIFLGNGDGTFAAAVHYAVDPGPAVLADGDFDNDGNVDVAIGHASSAFPGTASASVLFGNGDGTFSAVAASPDVGQYHGIAVADFDTDGNADLVLVRGAFLGNPGFTVLRGHGDRTFDAPVHYAAPATSASVSAADFDNDGDADLAITDPDAASVWILPGNGDATFGAGVAYAVGISYWSVVADFNGDSSLDLALPLANDIAGGVAILLGNGDGTFAAPVTYATGPTPFHTIADDVDGDGRLDLAMAGLYSSDVSVVLGNGDGSFRPPLQYFAAGRSWAMTSADFNGDGSTDLVTLSSRDSVAVLIGTGDGGFLAASSFPLFVYEVVNAFSIGDFNGDGRQDAAVAISNPGDVVAVVGMKADGNFGGRVDYAAGTDPWSVAIADLDSDGSNDLVVANQGSNDVSILLGNRDGTFDAAVNYAAGTAPVSIATGDWNGDSKIDLAVANSGSAYVSILNGVGDGTLIGTTYASGAAATAIVAADLNGDGHPDLAITTANEVRIAIGNGDGTFASPVLYPVGAGPIALAAGDLDGDGVIDIVAGGTSHTISILLGNGDGTFAAAVSYPTPHSARSIAFADFDSDGARDIVAALSDFDNVDNRIYGETAILLGAGDGSFPVIEYPPNDVAVAIRPLEANGDGRSDILSLQEAGTLSLMLNNTGTATINTPPSVAPGGTAIASTSNRAGSTYAWTITNGAITAGQGTWQVQYTGGAAGTRTTLSVTETRADACPSTGTARVMADFLDVPHTHPFHASIVRLARNGITAGCGGGNYCPGDAASRSQMAVFVLRGEHGEAYAPPPATGIFADVAVPWFFADFIERLYNEGITGGCATDPLRYCPADPVLRSQMAIFLLRAERGSAYAPPPATGIFADVPIGSFGANFIEQLYREGITGGCAMNPLRYCPNDATNRASMAVFLTRAFDLQ